MLTLEFERLVEIRSSLAWQVVADVVGYANYASNLSKASVEGEGLGMKRRCWDTRGQSWLETCTLWETGERYSFEVDTSVYPYPFKVMKGTWRVKAEGDKTLITMRFDYEPKYGLVGKWLVSQQQGRFRALAEDLLNNWEKAMLNHATAQLEAVT